MMKDVTTSFPIRSVLCVGLVAGAGPALAVEPLAADEPVGLEEGAVGLERGPTAPAYPEGQASEEMEDAIETLRDAAEVVEQMARDEGVVDLLDDARAVFIVPDYLRASFLVGGAGGEGVLMARIGGEWSGPAFYDLGAINTGLEAGIEAGSIAFFLMTQEALDAFNNENNFSLNADLGLTIIDFSARAQAAAGKGADVVVWSDTEGLYGSVAISVTNIFWAEDDNAAYYRGPVSLAEILSGNRRDPLADNALRVEFSALEVR